MSIITDKLPTSITVLNEEYPIRVDYRIWIKFSREIFSGNIKLNTLAKTLKIVLDRLPPRLDLTINAVMDFYNPKEEKDGGSPKRQSQRRIYDYDYDAELIYAAFMQQYKLDLTSCQLHWWQFRALFDSLTDETNFIKIVGYRSTDVKTIKDKELKKFYSKMKRLYRLPDNRTEEQKEEDFKNSFLDAYI